MKTLILLASLLVSHFLTYAQEPNQGITITVTVPNVTSSEGEVLFGLYDENTFMKSAPIKTGKSTIVEGTAKVTFTNIPEGVFAISCFHDVNGNYTMDFEPNRMPKENYGVSNNNMSYGPPIWNDAKFEVKTENLDLEIRM
ncbi:DUF2141 domain-containing protein [Aquimarina sediminis]|uniref:DUF2141 domain-containing protein n=1 Tax=Aquimarina sediminis TaxID=2070536 RepID=UPI000CA0141E|nr:DUF2141 domain-containing protein [Aquimarina sediminis]